MNLFEFNIILAKSAESVFYPSITNVEQSILINFFYGYNPLYLTLTLSLICPLTVTFALASCTVWQGPSLRARGVEAAERGPVVDHQPRPQHCGEQNAGAL